MKRKPYWELTSEELAEATKEFDEPFVVIDLASLHRPNERNGP